MTAPYNIQFGAGITMGSGIGFNTTPGGGGGDITLTYAEFDPSGTPAIPGNLQDTSGSVTGTGIVITNPTQSGVRMTALTAPNLAFVSANLPDAPPPFAADGRIWTAQWSGGSTYATTPVAIYYSTVGGFPAIIFYIMDPADGSYTTGAGGIYNFPVTLTAGTTATSYFTM
jgi:hypothetical protein